MKLSDICDVYSGYAFKTFNDLGQGIPVIKISNLLTDGSIDLINCLFTTENIKEKFYSKKSDIYIALSGATTGKISIMDKDDTFAINQRVGIVRNRSTIPNEYLKYFLMSKSNRILEEASGCAQPNISPKQIANYDVPKCSGAEMNKIVSELRKIDKIKNTYQKQLELLDELVRARFVEMFGDPVDNPMNWKKKKLKDIVTEDCTISYGIVQTGEEQKEGVPVFRPVDIVNHTPKVEELKKTTEFISDRYKKTLLKGHELLITVRANIADTFIADEEFMGCNVGRGIVPIRTQEDIMRLEFLKCLIDNKHLNDILKSKAKGITLIQLNMEDLRNVELIIPPIDLQIDYLKYSRLIDKSRLLRNHSLFLIKSIIL